MEPGHHDPPLPAVCPPGRHHQLAEGAAALLSDPAPVRRCRSEHRRRAARARRRLHHLEVLCTVRPARRPAAADSSPPSSTGCAGRNGCASCTSSIRRLPESAGSLPLPRSSARGLGLTPIPLSRGLPSSHGRSTPYRALQPRGEEAARPARRPLSKGGSVLEHIGGDHEFAQGLILVIHRFACFIEYLVEAVGGSANVLHCSRPVLIGFFEGVESRGHTQSSLPQPQRLRPPSVTVIGYWVAVPTTTRWHRLVWAAIRRATAREALILARLGKFADLLLG